MKKLIVALLGIVVAGVGCHGQVPPTNHVVNLSWKAAQASGSWTGCVSSAPCSYIVSRATLAVGTTFCPTPSVTAPNYTPLNDKTPTSALTYSDPSVSGLTVCYVVQTQQGTAISSPSDPTSVLVVPPNPLAPVIQTPQVAEHKTVGFPAPTPQLASASPTGLNARIGTR